MKKSKYIIWLYYAILLLAIMMRQNSDTEPSVMIRLSFLLAVVVPTFFVKTINYSVIITLFYSVSVTGVGFSYMPYTLYQYVIITIIVVFMNRNNSVNIRPPAFFYFFAVYIFLVDLLNGIGLSEWHLFEGNFYCCVLLLCFWYLNNIESRNDVIKQMNIGFAIVTLFLSITFFINRERFAIDYYGSGLERSGWTDPNYFGTILGMGTMCALVKLFSSDWENNNFVEKALFIATLITSVPVLLLNASRGAIVAIAVGFIILLMTSKAKSTYKFLATLAVCGGLFYLYSHSYFDLLLFRIETDDGTGSNRTVIWAIKLAAYSEGNLFQILFGNGTLRGANLTGHTIGFHNDFVGFLVDYGIVGLSMLLYMLVYPLRLMPSGYSNKYVVYSLLIYLGLCMMTLEPFITGIVGYFLFYLYIVTMAQPIENSSNNQLINYG